MTNAKPMPYVFEKVWAGYRDTTCPMWLAEMLEHDNYDDNVTSRACDSTLSNDSCPSIEISGRFAGIKMLIRPDDESPRFSISTTYRDGQHNHVNWTPFYESNDPRHWFNRFLDLPGTSFEATLREYFGTANPEVARQIVQDVVVNRVDRGEALADVIRDLAMTPRDNGEHKPFWQAVEEFATRWQADKAAKSSD